MTKNNLTDADLKEFTTLLSADLENGDVDKVVSLFQYNKALYPTVGEMMKIGTLFVRLGVNMLIEDLREKKPDDVKLAIPYLIPLLRNENPTIRGDVADLIGMIGDKEQITDLSPLLKDHNSQVIEMAREAIAEINERG